MRITNQDFPTNETEIRKLASELGIAIPLPLQNLYLQSNGGRPDDCVFESGKGKLLISSFLPLSSYDKDTAVDCYKYLVTERHLLPRNMFPFAIDPGGDYFLIDTSKNECPVLIYQHDTYFDDQRILDLHVSLNDFLGSLRSE